MRVLRRLWRRRSFRRGTIAATCLAAALVSASNTARSMIGGALRGESLFDMRSPGERHGALLQTKIAAAGRPAGAPHSRVLSEERSRPEAPGAAAPDVPGGEPLAGGNDLPLGAVPAALGAVPADFGPGIPGTAALPGAVGGGPIPNLVGVDLPTTPVPEPGTYALLGLGVGIAGLSLRRQAARARLIARAEVETKAAA